VITDLRRFATCKLPIYYWKEGIKNPYALSRSLRHSNHLNMRFKFKTEIRTRLGQGRVCRAGYDWLCSMLILESLKSLLLLKDKRKISSYPCNRPRSSMEVWDVEAPTFSTKSSHRWPSGCQSYAPVDIYSLVLFSVSSWDILRLVVIFKLKIQWHHRQSNRRPCGS
jgi:hypothetical protein